MTLETMDAAPTDPASTPATPTPARLRRARMATRAQFAALGIATGAWGVHIPSVKARFELGELMLSVVLLAAAVGALLSLLVAGRLVGRFGARRTAVVAATTMGCTLALVMHCLSLWQLLPIMVLFGASISLFDVAINTEGTVLESLSGRPVMSNLHAMFSVGAMAGAIATGGMLRADVAPWVQLAAIGSAAVAMTTLAARAMLETHPVDPHEGTFPHFTWPRGALLLIGLLIFAGMTAEGVMYDWSVLYLKQEVGMSQDAAALGYAAFAGAMALTRFAADGLRSRYAERRLLLGGALLTAMAMALVLISGHPGLSIVGYALIGAGLAPVVPILFTAASKVPGTRRAAAIAAASSIGYAGFMVGPPLVGGIAHAASLTAAMSVVVLAAGLLALGARKIA